MLNETVKESKGIKKKKKKKHIETNPGGKWNQNCPQSAGLVRRKTERKGNKGNQHPNQPIQGTEAEAVCSILFFSPEWNIHIGVPSLPETSRGISQPM